MTDSDSLSPETLVCPACGNPAGEDDDCPVCGCHLAALPELQTRARWEQLRSVNPVSGDVAKRGQSVDADDATAPARENAGGEHRRGLFLRRRRTDSPEEIEALRRATDALRAAFDSYNERVRQATAAVKAGEKTAKKVVSDAAKNLQKAETVPLVAYAGNIRIFQDRVQTPKGTYKLDDKTRFSVESAGNMSVTRRHTLTRAALLGPVSIFTPKATKHDVRELYFIAEHPEWAVMAALNPDAGAGARQAAMAANLAARNAESNRSAHQTRVAEARSRNQAAQRQAHELRAENDQKLSNVFEGFDQLDRLAHSLAEETSRVPDANGRAARQARKLIEQVRASAPARRIGGPGPSRPTLAAGAQPPQLLAPSRASTGSGQEAPRVSPLVKPDSAVLVLVDPGPRKIAVIKALRKHTGWGLAATKDFVDASPNRLADLTREAAEALAESLGSAGATVQLEVAETRRTKPVEGGWGPGASSTPAAQTNLDDPRRPQDKDDGHEADEDSNSARPGPEAVPEGVDGAETETAGKDVLTQLERLGALRASGLLTEDEFAKLKGRLLSKGE